MSPEQIWQEEQNRVTRVVQLIENQLETLQDKAGDLRSDIMEIRKTFWDDVTVNFDDPDDAIETAAAMKQQAELLSERERSYRHAHKQVKALTRLKDSPYFGRIDFLERGEKQAEQIYVGTSSFLDESGMQFLVYDWRAPISSLYYDYAPGPAQYDTPMGTIGGEMTLKRQFVIRGGTIESLFDTGVTIGDELLKEVLGKHSNAQMKSIVATIQREQNRIIRDEKSRLLIVQGAAGSGKTSAALQRVAYLLYRFRDTLKAEQIVLFSPNPMFNSYVSTVLPELGEENMQQTTYQEYLERRLGGEYRIEDAFEQMEYAYSAMEEPGYGARMEGIRFKASVAFMDLIDRYVERLGRSGLQFRDVMLRDRVLIPASRIGEMFYELDSSLRIPNRMQLLQEQLLAELRQIARRELKESWVDEEIEYLDQEELLKAFRQLQKHKRFSETTFDDFSRERNALAEVVIRREFKKPRSFIKRLAFLDTPGIYRQLFEDPGFIAELADGIAVPDSWNEICRLTLERLESGEFSYEDATPYLYMTERLEGSQSNNTIRHVFIDEAQDYSPFQYAMIKRFFPRAKMTVLGDLNQAIHAHVSGDGSGIEALKRMFGEDEVQKIVLTRSYRSTRQIVEFSRGLIEGGEEIELFHRDGPKPTWTDAANDEELASLVAERVRKLQEAGHRTVAIICKTVAESKEAYERLKNRLPVKLIGSSNASFETGTLIIPSYLAKGVEFDCVVIYNASSDRYARENERKLFYTACTRAMHELHLFSVGERTPFLAGTDPNTYTEEK